MPWVRHPDAAGVKVPEAVKRRTKERILQHSEKVREQLHAAGYSLSPTILLRRRVYGAFGSSGLDSDGLPREPRGTHRASAKHPNPSFRLRFFGDEERWAFAFFAYSHETYELSILPSGDFFGTPEEALDAAAESYWG